MIEIEKPKSGWLVLLIMICAPTLIFTIFGIFENLEGGGSEVFRITSMFLAVIISVFFLLYIFLILREDKKVKLFVKEMLLPAGPEKDENIFNEYENTTMEKIRYNIYGLQVTTLIHLALTFLNKDILNYTDIIISIFGTFILAGMFYLFSRNITYYLDFIKKLSYEWERKATVRMHERDLLILMGIYGLSLLAYAFQSLSSDDMSFLLLIISPALIIGFISLLWTYYSFVRCKKIVFIVMKKKRDRSMIITIVVIIVVICLLAFTLYQNYKVNTRYIREIEYMPAHKVSDGWDLDVNVVRYYSKTHMVKNDTGVPVSNVQYVIMLSPEIPQNSIWLNSSAIIDNLSSISGRYDEHEWVIFHDNNHDNLVNAGDAIHVNLNPINYTGTGSNYLFGLRFIGEQGTFTLLNWYD